MENEIKFNPYGLIIENGLAGDYIRQEDVVSLINQAYKIGMYLSLDDIESLKIERDELQKQVIGLENEVNYLDNKIISFEIYSKNIKQ